MKYFLGTDYKTPINVEIRINKWHPYISSAHHTAFWKQWKPPWLVIPHTYMPCVRKAMCKDSKSLEVTRFRGETCWELKQTAWHQCNNLRYSASSRQTGWWIALTIDLSCVVSCEFRLKYTQACMHVTPKRLIIGNSRIKESSIRRV